MDPIQVIYNALLPLQNAPDHIAGKREFKNIISNFEKNNYQLTVDESLRSLSAKEVFETIGEIPNLELKTQVTQDMIKILGSKGIVYPGMQRFENYFTIRTIDTIRHWNGKSDKSLYDTLNEVKYSRGIN